MNQRHFLGITFALMTSTLAGASAAANGDGADIAAAESLFQEGLNFKAQRNFEEASKRFARSEELAPAVGTLINLGECYEQLHRIASAWLAYRQAITLAEAKNDKRTDHARSDAARLEPRVPHLTIVVTGAAEGETITRDGQRVESAALSAAVAVDPGPHVIAASAPDRKSWQQTVLVVEGGSASVTVPELGREAKSPRRAIGIGMEIGGGAILAAGLIAGAISFGKWRTVDDACPNYTCPPKITAEQQAEVDGARTWALLGTVGIIAGAAILAGGIALHLTAPKETVSLYPTFGNEAAGVSLVWRR